MKSTWTVVLASAMPLGVLAHGGGLNADGCHTNRKTGDYHCHRAPSGAAPVLKARPGTPTNSVSPSTVRPAHDARTCYVGPRGGTYTITKSGKKNYSGC